MITIEPIEIPGMHRIIPHVFSDNRGKYRKYYERKIFNDYGINDIFTESSEIHSQKGVIRGLHYQTGNNSQSKLVHILKGKIFDVAVDLRKDSETFGMFHCELLDSTVDKLLYIPKGFAHGFLSLEDDTLFSYQSAGAYEPENSGGIIWNDSEMNIPWPLKEYDIQNIIVTEKDSNWPTLKEYRKMNGGE
ncbi:MAG: dTDP-4-dehydrorhamnose 3,5-epimerase [Treponema sp.]|nr:dTDP-4-dehydrorhamnose 3,5-epimerase [Treponema sp.]